MYIYVCIRLNINIKAPGCTMIAGPVEGGPRGHQTCASWMCPCTRSLRGQALGGCGASPKFDLGPAEPPRGLRSHGSKAAKLPEPNLYRWYVHICQGCQHFKITSIPRLPPFQGYRNPKVTTIPRLPQILDYFHSKVTIVPRLPQLQGYHSQVTTTHRLPVFQCDNKTQVVTFQGHHRILR